MENQMTIFDFLKEDTEFDVLLEYAKHGSGFARGNERIFDFFNKCDDEKERIKFLKNEYGVGGFGSPIKKPFYIHESCNDASGITLEWYGANMENHKADFTYKQLAQKIQLLIVKGEYLERRNNESI